MLAAYFKERDGAETITKDYGFLAYLIVGNQFYITEFYLDEASRNSPKKFLGLMREARAIAIEKDCENFGCHVRLTLKNLNQVLATRLKFGFKVTTMDSEKIGMILALRECEWAEAEDLSNKLPRL